jgi:hypothetical protein
MSLSSNKLTKQVDLPVWEWTRPLPTGAVSGLSSSCVADNTDFNAYSGKFVYLLLTQATANFWRYDTVADSYMQLASPVHTAAAATGTSMRFAGGLGYYGKVISATSNTIQAGLPFSGSAVGFRVRITSGKGAGQTRIVRSVSEPVSADIGTVTAITANTTSCILTDANKNWGIAAGTGSYSQLNNWAGYVVRITTGTGVGQMRKILYNSQNTIAVADANMYAINPWAMPLGSGTALGFVTNPAVASDYSIESSVLTVDTAWDVQPDDTSVFMIQSGGIVLASTTTTANGGVAMQYYCVLSDMWYAKAVQNTMVPVTPTDLSIERLTENSSLWYSGTVTAGTTGSITDSNASWASNEWASDSVHYAYIWTGTGRGQIARILSNTSNTLTFASPISVAPDSTSRYDILGYDGGMVSSTSGRIVFDSTKNWAVNRWTNYAIRILSGTGAGQLRQIQSNGYDSIVVVDPWNVQPDSSSIYIIQAYPHDVLISVGGNSQPFIYRMNDVDLLSHGRILDEGILQVACAIPTDGGSTASHEIYEQKPIAITGLAGTTTITATTAIPHGLKVGQRVSIRGVTNLNNAFNVTGKVQIATVPSTTSFTYTPNAAGTGTYTLSNGVALSTSNLVDASKYHGDTATGGSTTTITFARAQPSNINGWYVTGTNVTGGAQVASGAGGFTLTLSAAGVGTPSGIIQFTKFPVQTALSTAVGSANGFTFSSATTVPLFAKGWLTTGTNIGIGAILTGGENGLTAAVSIQNAGTVSGGVTLSNPVNNPLPATGFTYASGTGLTLTLTANSPTYVNGWWVSGTGVANATRVVSGAGGLTLSLTNALTGTPTSIQFNPPTTGVVMFYGNQAAPAVSTATTNHASNAMQLVAGTTAIYAPIAAVGAANAGISKYVLARREPIATQFRDQNIYLSGVAVGVQSVTTLVDTNSFWGNNTGSGTTGSTTITLNALGSYIHNGWYAFGTGITSGTKVVSGAGSTLINLDTPTVGTVSGGITFSAWGPWNIGATGNLPVVARRLRILSSTAANSDYLITSVTASTGTLTFATATAGASGSSSYVIVPGLVPGAGSSLQWISDSSIDTNAGRNVIRVLGGGSQVFTRIDLTTDKIAVLYTSPQTETLTTGSMYAYDQYDRLYFTKDATNRCYYLDCNTLLVHGAGVVPYLVPTAALGNFMEVFKTQDGLKYLWLVRKGAAANVEVFRQLVFY